MNQFNLLILSYSPNVDAVVCICCEDRSGDPRKSHQPYLRLVAVHRWSALEAPDLIRVRLLSREGNVLVAHLPKAQELVGTEGDEVLSPGEGKCAELQSNPSRRSPNLVQKEP